ncbi:PREDICTED: uncharacterized protein LOC104802397 isoform X2 [Tarenaya hassleriana]|uniref:uncharacterized protein LOC104802397 isoform X2 n=1 Tax=Tarenaya hassleriana TaxID=28532 RepID=UPI0008FD898E|nr:PREDICTED: uncharacterized protein LOC104802397 isoform X2 [Tarenaya hassleriana]
MLGKWCSKSDLRNMRLRFREIRQKSLKGFSKSLGEKTSSVSVTAAGKGHHKLTEMESADEAENLSHLQQSRFQVD